MRHPLDPPKEANLVAVQFLDGLWAFIRIARDRDWGVWGVCSQTPELPKFIGVPEKWFFSGVVDRGNQTPCVHLGVLPFASEDEGWSPPTYEGFSVGDRSLVFHRGTSWYATREEVAAQGIPKVMRGTLKNLVDKLREFYAAGLLTLVEPAPAGSTSLIPPKPLKKTPTKRKSSISASAKVSFDAGGMDRTSFAPFVLQNVDEDGEFRLIFSDWEWLHKLCGGDHLGDYYLNGPGVEGIVLATREINRLDPEPECMDLNSEGDACYIHFTDRDEAIRTATLSAKTINDRRLLRKAVKVALDQGYGD